MKLTDHIHLVGGGARGMGISHDADCPIYLVTDGHEAAIIDAGAGLEPELILANIASDGIPRDQIKYLILTHCHGDVIRVGSLRLEVFSTPGHAPIHNAYLLRESGRTSLFSGDLVFSGGAVSIIWSPDTSVFDMGESIGRFRDMGIDALYPGHDDISLSGGQRHIDAALARFENLVVPHSMLLD